MLKKCKAIFLAAVLAASMPGSIKVMAADDMESVVVGYLHSLALNSDGSLWAWGGNESGQLGDGTTKDKSNPVKIMDGVKSVSTGNTHNLAIKNDGSLWAWGDNLSGQLGDGTKENKSSPVKIMEDVKFVSAGISYSMAIKNDGSLWSWGNDWAIDFRKHLGDGAAKDKSIPAKIMEDVKFVSAGAYLSLVIKNDGSLWAWGDNFGKFGDGTTRDKSIPIKVMEDVKSASVGDYHNLAIKTDGSLWAWGINDAGSLGDGTTEDKSSPVKIMEDVKLASTKSGHSLAIKTDGSLWSWGNDWGFGFRGQLGDGTKESKSSPVKILEGVKSVSAGINHNFAIKTDGSLWAWGSNENGQLGDGTKEGRLRPTKIIDGLVLGAGAPAPTAQTPTVNQSTNNATTSKDISVVVNGKTVSFPDQQPVIQNGRTLVPVRGIFEELGFVVTWDNNTSAVTLKNGSDTVVIPVGKASFTVNGKTITPDVPSQIINGSTMLPLRAICDSLGTDVNWNSTTQTAIIEYKGTSGGSVQSQIVSTSTNSDELSYLPTPGFIYKFPYYGVISGNGDEFSGTSYIEYMDSADGEIVESKASAPNNEPLKDLTFTPEYSYFEDSTGLYKRTIGKSGKDTPELMIKYPLKVGEKFQSTPYDIYKITAVNETVTTNAGIFENCVAVTHTEFGATCYYAPGVGLVKYEGTREIEELEEIIKRN